MHLLTVFTDGGSRGNPGPAASAFVIFDNNNIVGQGSKFLGETTNNVAEYEAVLLALDFIDSKWGDTTKLQLKFNLDSLLVVSQLSGRYKIKSQNMIDLALRIKDKVKNFGALSFSYVPREQNAIADALVNKCLDEN